MVEDFGLQKSRMELKYKLKTELENLRHQHIMDEIRHMAMNGVNSFKR